MLIAFYSKKGDIIMCFICSLIPFTIYSVIGYFVLYASNKTESFLRKFGQILAIWIFIVAICFPICGVYMSISDKCPMDKIKLEIEIDDENHHLREH